MLQYYGLLSYTVVSMVYHDSPYAILWFYGESASNVRVSNSTLEIKARPLE